MPETGVPLARAFARLEIQAVEAGTSVQSAVRKAGESGQKEAESQASKIRGKLAQGFEFGAGFYGGEALFQGVAAGIKTVIESADQLKESSERVDRVFGESSGSVLKFGQDAAKSYGLSAVAADQMSVKLGALLTNLKLPQAEAAKMSEKLVGLAADLAAFNHTDTASAEQALQSALAGRTQGLKQYGIVVDAVSVQQQALKDGLIHTVKDALDPAAKAQATYEVILQRSGVQQGAFARGSNSLAEQAKILQAEVTDAGAAVGQKLIPVLVGGAKGLQDLGHGAADVANFFEHNAAAATLLAGALTTAAIPSIIRMGSAVAALAEGGFETLALKALYAGDAIKAAFVANPEVFALVAGFTAATAAVELFSGHEKAAAIDVQSLTDAVKRQDAAGGDVLSNQILKQFTDTDIANKGQNVLEYLQHYKVNVSELVDALNRGDTGKLHDLLTGIFNDSSVSGDTKQKLALFFTQLIGDIGSTRKADVALAAQDAATKAQLDKTPQGRFIEYLGSVTKAQDTLTKSAADNNKTISGQIDLLKGYQAQADVTASSIQQHILDSIKQLANEGENLKTLAANGVNGDFINQLVSEGPEYVAAIAAASKQQQLQISQQYAAGQTQKTHTVDESSRAENPQQAATVAFFNGLQSQANNDAMAKTFYTAVQTAVDKAKEIAGDGGRETASAFGAKGEAGRNTVLQAFLKTLPGPVQQAALSALGIATDAGGKLPQNLAGAIISHIPRATSAAEALRLAVQNRIDLLHGKTIDVITQDNASDALRQITGNIKTLEAYNNTLKAERLADGGPVNGAGGPRDDVIPLFGSNGEWMVDARSTSSNRDILAWMKSNPGMRVPGYADGGPVVDQITTHPFVQSFADYLSGGAFSSLLAGVSGGASAPQSVQAWAPTILQALGLAGAPASWLAAEETIMRLESGGNPTIQNLGYTAGGGHPTGLMQMLPATFLAHALPGLGNIVNGLDNLVSSIRYQESEYGSPFNIPGVVRGSYGGYDHGGILPPGTTLAYNGTGRPENVQTADQRDEQTLLLKEQNRLLKQQNQLLAAIPGATAAGLNDVARAGRLAVRTGSARR